MKGIARREVEIGTFRLELSPRHCHSEDDRHASLECVGSAEGTPFATG